jgi:hypothetical protein
MKIDCGRYLPTLALVAVTAFPLFDWASASDAVDYYKKLVAFYKRAAERGQVIILAIA